MLKRTAILELVQSSDLLRPQKRSATLGPSGKHGSVKFVLGNKIAFTRSAAQEIRRDRVTELNRGVGALLAEQNHVGEVGIFILSGRCFTEDAARWEDGCDGADNETGWIEGQVTGVVLEFVR